MLRVNSVNYHGEQHLSRDQTTALVRMMHQINECLVFVNTYSRQSYCTFVSGVIAIVSLTLLAGNITIKGLYKNNISVIENLIVHLTNMNEQFDAGGKMAAEVSIHRIDQLIGGIGRRSIDDCASLN